MKYDIILSDPAWKFRSNSAAKKGRNVSKEYPTMTLEEIKQLDVGSLANKNSMLLLWITTPLLDKFPEVLKAWGFKFKGVFTTWVKLNKDGTVFKGMGYLTRKNTEILIYATKGRGVGIPTNRSVSELIFAEDGEVNGATLFSRRRKHSQKPDEIYDIVDILYPNKTKIELFARLRREGWSAWGNEVTNDIHIATPQCETVNCSYCRAVRKQNPQELRNRLNKLRGIKK